MDLSKEVADILQYEEDALSLFTKKHTIRHMKLIKSMRRHLCRNFVLWMTMRKNCLLFIL